jgi:hypothetical protein
MKAEDTALRRGETSKPGINPFSVDKIRQVCSTLKCGGGLLMRVRSTPTSVAGATSCTVVLSMIAMCAGCHPTMAEAPLCDETSSPLNGGAIAASAPLATVPINLKSFDGVVRFTIPVSINGIRLDAQLDTGSPALRVLEQFVADAGLVRVSDAGVSITFNGGLILKGYQATARVGLDGIDIPDVPIHVVTDVCNVAGQCGLDGGVFGANANFGASLRDAPGAVGRLRSPLSSIPGTPAFDIRMFGPVAVEAADAGELRIGVSQEQYATYTSWVKLLPQRADVSAPVWNDLGIQTCFDDQTAGTGCVTQGTFIDTGAPVPYIESLDAGGPGRGMALPADHAVQARIVGPDAGCFVTDYLVPSDKLSIRRLDAGPTFNNLGYQVFFESDVLFDPSAGWIALKKPRASN